MTRIKRFPETTNIKIKVKVLQQLLRDITDHKRPDSPISSDTEYQYFTAFGLRAKQMFDDAQGMLTPKYRTPHIRSKIYSQVYNKIFTYYMAQLDHPDYQLFGQIVYQIISPLLDPNRIALIKELKDELSGAKQLAPAPSVLEALDHKIITHAYITEIRQSILDEASRYGPDDADYLAIVDRRIIAKLRRDPKVFSQYRADC